MIFSIGFDIINIDDNLQIGISKNTVTGGLIARESLSEQPTDGDGAALHSEVSGKPYLINSANNFVFLEGKFKLKFEWEDSDKFDSSHVDEYISLVNSKLPGMTPPTVTKASDHIESIYTIEECSGTWRAAANAVEPNCAKGSIEVVEKDSVILCPMQRVKGWTFERVDIPVGGNVTSEKVGSTEYLIFGQECKIGGTTIAKHSIKKQTSSSLTVENNSSSFCRLVRIYK